MSQDQRRKRSVLSRIVRRIIIWVYHAKGWTLDGGLPDIPKFVIAGAPHSSNWDFVFFTGATAEEGVEPNFMGKHTLFKGIMKNFMYDMGGIPIDRTKRANYVEQVADEFARRDKLALVIAAEGTRTTDGSWKSGFYHIARAANVPIVPAWVCNERNILGFGPPIMPTDNYGETLLEIARFMRSKLPEYGRYKVLEEQALRLVAVGGKEQ
ncbi:1-acyl-sn-glycerol-3-phosphate acyltransferase [Qipengyuania zhejiangensis]|uniref:1-acyl-sn-glycerol-3-phosphate acyltransferase n=1 Tax=Qipengyuania zhejiangensis TaxID=3077782 RepID=UPI002D79293B|nr:1-acyl-sn-glycerol-3-phosphate acyltransferase [Qipengyuania sp. Z2]